LAETPYPLAALGPGKELAILGGVHFGYYYQLTNSVVLGAVGEFNLSNFGRGGTVAGGGTGGAVSTLSSHDNWQAFVMGRAGYAIDRLLIYGAGGLALANYQANISVYDPNRSSTPFASSQTKTLPGWAVGVGAEYAIDMRWTINAELRYADFGRASFALPQNLGGPGSATKYEAGFRETIGLVGVSYRF
jgi:outer membrane immunogenic protein